ncbi:hypothetical protein AAEI00_21785, partial [Shewanella algae]|uniref:hypothetical protein n=1 Tax=Shewanella algae TaxID=38313 RepID=UPI00318F7216
GGRPGHVASVVPGTRIFAASIVAANIIAGRVVATLCRAIATATAATVAPTPLAPSFAAFVTALVAFGGNRLGSSFAVAFGL